MSSSSTSTISSEWVNDLDAGFLEIARIPRGNGQAINERSRGDQTVLERHRVSGSAESCQQLRPADAGSGLDGETDEVHNALVKPTLEPLTSSARRHPVNAEADFANDDRINCDLNLIATQPFQDLCHRGWLGGLAEDVRVDEVGHPSLGSWMSSVVSVRSRGWNQPFSGQFNSQSTGLCWKWSSSCRVRYCLTCSASTRGKKQQTNHNKRRCRSHKSSRKHSAELIS